MSRPESDPSLKGEVRPQIPSITGPENLSISMSESGEHTPKNPSRRKFLKAALATLGLAFVGGASAGVVKAAENLAPLEAETLSGMSVLSTVGAGPERHIFLTKDSQLRNQISELVLRSDGSVISRSLGILDFEPTSKLTTYENTIAVGGIDKEGQAVVGVPGEDGSGVMVINTSRRGKVLDAGAVRQKVVMLVGEEGEIQNAKYVLFDPLRHDVVDLVRDGQGVGIMATGFRVTDPNRFVSFGQAIDAGYIRYLVIPGENKLQTRLYPSGGGLVGGRVSMSSYVDASGNDVVIYPGVIGRGDGPNAGVNVKPAVLDTVNKADGVLISQKILYPDSSLYGRQTVDIMDVIADTIKQEYIFTTAKRASASANTPDTYIEMSNLAGDYSSRYLLSRNGQWPELIQSGWVTSFAQLLRSGNCRKLVIGLRPGDFTITNADQILIADISNPIIDRGTRTAAVTWQNITQSIINPQSVNPQSVNRVYLSVVPKNARKT